MRVRVVYSTDVPDWYRRAIRRFYGQDGLATREEVRQWLRTYGTSMDDDLGYQEDQAALPPDERQVSARSYSW